MKPKKDEDNSFLDDMADLCLDNLHLTFRDPDFFKDLLFFSPFPAYLLLKVLSRDE